MFKFQSIFSEWMRHENISMIQILIKRIVTLFVEVMSDLDALHTKNFEFLLVPPIQYGAEKIMTMTVFLFLKFNRLPFF